MDNDFVKLNDSNINIQKAKNLLTIIQNRRNDPNYTIGLQSESGLFSSLFAAFQNFFNNLGKPTIQKRLLKLESPAYSSDYNETMTEIYNDTTLAYSEEENLSSLMVQNFNYNEAERQMLASKVALLNSDSLDYALYTKGLNTQSLFATDNFVNNSKIDLSKLTGGATAAEIDPSLGVVTLARTGNTDLSSTVTSVTGIEQSITQWDPETSTGGYEGLFWAQKGGTRPEGGVFHLQYSSDGTQLYEMGATDDQMMPIRLNMFDSNPATFWEVEYVTSTITGYQNTLTGAQISVAEFNDLFNNDVSSANVQISGDTVVTSANGSLITNYVPITNAGVFQELTVNFTIHLKSPVTVNWISLNPNNFGQECYMQIIDVQTSPDGTNFVDVEDFNTYSSSNVLTQTVNSEVNPSQVQATLSPNQTQFSGEGLWTFAPRTVSAISFTINQPQSYECDYDILMVTISQTITITTTTTPSWFLSIFGAKPQTTTSTQTITSDVAIPYLVGQVTGFDVMDLEPGSTTVESGNVSPNWVIATEEAASNPVVSILLLGALGKSIFGPLIKWVFGGLFGSTSSTSTSSGPQTITKQWTNTMTDKSRFAIGIRDIDIYAYNFASTSEIVSTPYVSPAPISKVSLVVNEQVPLVFSQGNLAGTQYNYIKYYISVDNGTTWSQIAPMSHADSLSSDGVNLVPQIININSSVAAADRSNTLAYIDIGSPVYDIRFKADLSRPTSIPSSDSYTPVLYSYSLQIYPLGGL